MDIQEIQAKLQDYHERGKRIFVSSSFQTHSIPLLHILANSGVPIDVLFINTGFHFPQTLEFRDQVSELLGVTIIDVRPLVPKNQQLDTEGQFYFATDPDYCCYLNKTQPLEPYLQKYDIWISGVRANQSDTRKAMKAEQDAPFGTLRFHPILDWTDKDIHAYRQQYQLPEHPLDKEGYVSIGCSPCTRKLDLNDERSARWFGLTKTECGLHTDLISK